jgi:uncharacterized FlaG/YvyC family protein
MQISAIGGATLGNSFSAGSNSAQSESLRETAIAARQLNNLGIADREFSVVRDPNSHRFVVEVVERSTGTVLDQFPAESLLKLLAQFAAADKAPAASGEGSEE